MSTSFRPTTGSNATWTGCAPDIEGLLVDARRSDGWSWNTSLTREDDGKGACELMLVRSVRVIDAGE